MKLQVFSVLDNAIKAFNNPFVARTKLEAIRSFKDACNSEGSQFRKHAADYHLMYLGEFDDGDGSFAVGIPERVVGAVECIADEVAPLRAREL